MVGERRLFVRFGMSCTVVVQPDPQDKRTIDCELIDLSYEGVGMYSPQAFEPGGALKFIIINRQLNVNLGGLGRVVYCNPVTVNGKEVFRIGLELIDVDRAQVKQILMLVRDLSR
ncbi:MAG: PilZ domain-containing protein [Candidatus Omnitrophica bacterium]|nr:PilZ domain-containing protein [Candidatus Omnitrophota bacterium]